MEKKEFLLLLDELIEAEPGTVQDGRVLKDLEGWDSLAVVGFIALVDERFELTLAPKKIAECKTVADLVALLGDRVTPA